MTGKKRTRSGQVKPPGNVGVTESTPPCGQTELPSSNPIEGSSQQLPQQEPILQQQRSAKSAPKSLQKPSKRKPHPQTHDEKYHKLPKLPARRCRESEGEAQGRPQEHACREGCCGCGCGGEASGRGNGGRREGIFESDGAGDYAGVGVGVEVQSEGYVVRVEMGSVRAVDDVEVNGERVDGEGEEEEIPETRIRTISSVTVSIGMA
ncbi:hypothetical protein GQ44DRAFT_293961 [Phaeosphaeriaceae sp. PMI808]|nr:hypothetical protein GQ44DRAFT_293961 [Phaeosphaeriaceae sp. PMI808]